MIKFKFIIKKGGLKIVRPPLTKIKKYPKHEKCIL